MMQTYEQYKESGIDWIGQIPDNWEVSKVKNYLEIPITDGPHTTPILLDEGIPFISAEAIKNGKIDFSKKRGNISEEDYQIFSQKYLPKRNDIYMIKSGATTGNIAMVETDEIFTIWSPLAVFRSGKKILPRFLYNVLSSGYFRRGVELNWSFGTQQNIGMGILANLFITLPPIQEQEAIAKFLDDKIANIDALVQTKEQQIEKLKELRQVKIHQAVTKGLDANVPTKDSGIEWIGEIPAHWEVKRLKFIANLINEKSIAKDSKLPYYGMENIESWSGKYIESDSETEGLGNNFYKGNVLFGKLRPYLAKVHLAIENGICSSEFLVYEAKVVRNDYLKSLLVSPEFIKIINASTYGAKMPRANSDFINNQLVPIPPIQEQEQIVAYLDEVTGKIDQAIAQKQEQITKLKEYKQSLINDVVTGKVKVC